jgi:hypothetical protein
MIDEEARWRRIQYHVQVEVSGVRSTCVAEYTRRVPHPVHNKTTLFNHSLRLNKVRSKKLPRRQASFRSKRYPLAILVTGNLSAEGRFSVADPNWPTVTRRKQ